MRVGAVVLAAGASRRFGGDKLYAWFRGKPMLQHATEAVSQAVADGVLATGVVVLRPGDACGQGLVAAQGLRAVIAPDACLGLAQSLSAGLAALEDADPAAALVLLGDQPLVGVEAIAAVCRAARGIPAAIVRPRYDEEPDVPGHPVLLRRDLWASIPQLRGDAVFAHLSAQGAETRTVLLPGANPDVDTPSEFDMLYQRGRHPASPSRDR